VNIQSIAQKVAAVTLFPRLTRVVTRSDQFGLIRYLVAGVGVSLGYSLTIVVLVDWVALVSPEAANVLSLILWTTISYVVHREFTFRFDGNYGGSATRFIFIFLLKLLASVAVIAVITRYYQSSYLIGVLLNWVVMPLISYVAMKLWVFQLGPTSWSRRIPPLDVCRRQPIHNILRIPQDVSLCSHSPMQTSIGSRSATSGVVEVIGDGIRRRIEARMRHNLWLEAEPSGACAHGLLNLFRVFQLLSSLRCERERQIKETIVRQAAQRRLSSM
jgi:putative flippase GtrA